MKFLSSLSCLLALSCLLQFNLSAQTVNPTISIQGTLKNANGGAVADGDQSVTFRLFDALSGGNNVWEETATVEVTGGIYSHLLGSVTPLQAAFFNGPRFVEVVVDNLALTPRTTLSYAPYALVVETAQSALSLAPRACSGQVGDIKYSILKPTDFAMENGDCWVPMDGRNIPNTKLATYIGTVLPDAGGVFLRAQEWPGGEDRDPGRGAAAVIGQLQADAYASHAHGMQAAGAHTHNYGDYHLDQFQVGGYAGDNISNYSPLVQGNRTFGYTGDAGPEPGSLWTDRVRAGLGDGLEYMRFRINDFQRETPSSDNHTHAIDASGAAETRPKNMNFYVYIRID